MAVFVSFSCVGAEDAGTERETENNKININK